MREVRENAYFQVLDRVQKRKQVFLLHLCKKFRSMQDTDNVSLAGFSDSNDVSSQDITTDMRRWSTGFLLPDRVASSASNVSQFTRKTLRLARWLNDTTFQAAHFISSVAMEVSRDVILGRRRASAPPGISANDKNPSTAQQIDSNSRSEVFQAYLDTIQWSVSTWIELLGQLTSGSLMASEEVLKLLDGVFGSTETSSMLARFIDLLRRELLSHFLNSPSMLRGAMSFAYLQESIMPLLLNSGGATTLFQVTLDPESKLIDLQRPLTILSIQQIIRSCIQDSEETAPQLPSSETVPTDETRQLDWDSVPSTQYHISHEHLLYNLNQYVTYASGAYGHHFLRLLGVASYPSPPDRPLDRQGRVHHSSHVTFARHAHIPLENVFHSSFKTTSHHHAGTPPFETHSHSFENLPEFFASLNHQDKSVVVTFRGTLALADLLTNLECHYSTIKSGECTLGKVHSGMWKQASTHALVGSPLHRVTRHLLTQYPEYGLILVGHSLGAGMASLVALKWSNLVDSKNGVFQTSVASGLPPGRSLHAYLFGPPCVMSIQLSKATRGLITSVVHGFDFVATWSLGSSYDLRDISIRMGELGSGNQLSISHSPAIPAKILQEEFDSVVLANSETQEVCQQRAPASTPALMSPDADYRWESYKSIRRDINHEKLYVPGDVYWIRSETVDTEQEDDQFQWTKQRLVTMSYVEDVQKVLNGLFLSSSMLLDHSPARYEFCLKALVTQNQQSQNQ